MENELKRLVILGNFSGSPAVEYTDNRLDMISKTNAKACYQSCTECGFMPGSMSFSGQARPLI